MGANIIPFDEVSFRLVPRLARVWAPRGSKPRGTFFWSNKKRNLFGALINGRVYYDWFDRLNATAFILFLQRFVATLDMTKTYVFIFDNAPAHKAKKTEAYLESLPVNIHVEFLPPYSPQLNAIETCWKIVRHQVTNSTLFQSVEALQMGVEQFLDEHFFTLEPTHYLSR